ncbi:MULTISPECIES: GNAT family N-acetyltransferase [unclassified Shinella]|jgi:L-amino acid N-acyltransferase YncA|uniref:GNAT family N-acetyltransferase n=1 Tax=unclassified Shinella TaxID=2643062 RepID=UPI00234EE9D8|nr:MULTISPECIES: GNAT family N-acetyltransferase [unclassified Shinella]MCO5153907.1 GNAT family N-acetyltransferase [Shinella sp.]MDC7262870.1 GNAT family N-acetyltransferase [Shinella sp. HY16]MDC7269765.1 GNAT family N-acetyltransferase [Shinella sp. YZ44]
MTAEDIVPPPIRRLTAEDAEAFRALRREALLQAPAAFASTAEDLEKLSDEAIRKLLADLALFAAFRGKEPVGMMGLMRFNTSKMAHRANLVMVYLRTAERGRGVAGTLLAAVTAHARDSCLRQIELAVTAENAPALAFYRREGFAEIGYMPAGFLHEGREIDEILMMRRVV